MFVLYSQTNAERLMSDKHTAALLTIKQVSNLLGMHRNTISRLLNQGKIPGRKVGGSWRIPASYVIGITHAETNDHAESNS